MEPTVVQSLTHGVEHCGSTCISGCEDVGFQDYDTCVDATQQLAVVEESSDMSFTVYRVIMLICEPDRNDCCLESAP